MSRQQEVLDAHTQLLQPLRVTKAYIGNVARQAVVALDGRPATQPYANNRLLSPVERGRRYVGVPDDLSLWHGFALVDVTTTEHRQNRGNLLLREHPFRSVGTVSVGLEHPDSTLYFNDPARTFNISTDGYARFDEQTTYTFPGVVRRHDVVRVSSPEILRENYSAAMVGALAATQIVVGTLNEVYELGIDTSQSVDLVGEWRAVHASTAGETYELPHTYPFHPTLLLADSPEFQ